MLRQPFHTIARFLRSIRKALALDETSNSSLVLLPAVALIQTPADAFANVAFVAESGLLAAISVLAGVLGLSAALLYRHMHREEETVRARAENAEAELRALLLMTDDAVLMIAPNGTVKVGNPAAEEVFGRPSDEFIGAPLTQLIPQPLCLGELTKNGPVNFETTAKRPGEEFAHVEMLLSPVEFGGKTSYLALVHETRPAFPTIAEARSSLRKDLTQPLEKFTHDLNNQLTSMIGNLSLILMSPATDPANYERILNAKKTALRAQALSQNLQSLIAEDAPETDVCEIKDKSARTIVPMPHLTQSPQPSPRPTTPQKPKILILDDEEAICALVATALNSMGFQVTEATTVPAALTACEAAKQDAAPFDLIISDLSLPGDISGCEAVGRIRTICPNIKAIVSSGYDTDPVMRDCRKHGFAAAIAKPYEISKLGRTVREVLGAAPAEARKTA